MAVNDGWQQTVKHLVAAHIGKSPRYRTLLFNSGTLATLDGVVTATVEAAQGQSRQIRVTNTDMFVDAIGAISCSTATELIDAQSAEQMLVIAGPLNFLDYWSLSIRQNFWRHLATVNRGHIIVVTDVPRDVETESTFRLVTRVQGSDLHCLRSRLTTGEDEAS